MLSAQNNGFYQTSAFEYKFVPAGTQVSQLESLNRGFKSVDAEVMNLGFSDSLLAMRAELSATGVMQEVFIDNPLFDSIQYLIKSEDGDLIRQGTWKSSAINQQEYEEPIFQILSHQQKYHIYLLLSADSQYSVPVRILDSKQMSKAQKRRNYFGGVFYGILIALMLYNLFIAISTKDRSSYFYISYIFFIGITQSLFDGYFQVFINTQLGLNESTLLTIAPSIAGICALFFAEYFLKVKEHPSWILLGIRAFQIGYFLALLISFTGFRELAFRMIDLLAASVAVYGVIFSSVISSRGFRPAKFFLIAFALFLLSLILFVVSNLGFVEQNLVTRHVVQFGVSSQVILLSIALADRINILRKEKEQNQQEALKLAKENERITRYQNIELDRQVKARTAELEESNKNLQKTLSDLKEAQTQLVDSEKMASLGQLTAGIAHEINNPINFVTSNIKPLQRDIKDLYEIIDSYGNIVEGQEIQGLKEVEELKEDLEYDYVRQEIDNLLRGISEGANRTADIIIGLKTFSRLDEDVKKAADIVEGIESTLIILNTKIKDKIKLEKDYQEGMPQIECFPGKLNQAFMNILNNAIYALEHKNYEEGEKPTLTIKLRADEKNCYIHIIDNGIGMDEATQKKMFEPFYTTKEVGEGTGLGMSIVFNILDKHNGTIDVKSEEGKGTEFILTLPL